MSEPPPQEGAKRGSVSVAYFVGYMFEAATDRDQMPRVLDAHVLEEGER
jgi:hypothetical protein